MATGDVPRQLSARLRHLRERVTGLRRAGTGDEASSASAGGKREAVVEPDVVRGLQRRLDHVERELEGLQDSVHRESRRRDDEIAALRRQLQPGELARSLSEEARKRGV